MKNTKDILAEVELRESMDSDTKTELPRYVCHKTVHALKIAQVLATRVFTTGEERHPKDGTGILVPENPSYAPFRVSREFMERHRPVEGGYFVVYDDGYRSFSPAKAFEDGYTLVE